MKARDLVWLGAFAGTLAKAVPGSFGSSKHRKARMLRFAFRSGGKPLRRKLIEAQQRHERTRIREKAAASLQWSRAIPGPGAPKPRRERGA